MAAQPHTVLLVEDHEDNRVVYRTILEYEGYRVLEARDGAEGIATARRELPDLILMDVAIPRVDGLEATRRLKADPVTSSIPIVAVTAKAMAADRAKCLAAGCDGYLAKPVRPVTIVDEVRKILGPPGPVAAGGGSPDS